MKTPLAINLVCSDSVSLPNVHDELDDEQSEDDVDNNDQCMMLPIQQPKLSIDPRPQSVAKVESGIRRLRLQPFDSKFIMSVPDPNNVCCCFTEALENCQMMAIDLQFVIQQAVLVCSIQAITLYA